MWNLNNLFHRLTVMFGHVLDIRSHLPAIKNRNFNYRWRRDSILSREPISSSNFSEISLKLIISGL